MSVTMPAVASALITGVLIGAGSTRPKLRRTRAELADTRLQAECDPLTGLPNRAGALRHLHLQAAVGRAQAAVLLDLDKFKTVNDTWGHQTGDALLVAIAARLAHACTSIDALAARLSGDEFLLLLPQTDPRTVLSQVVTVLNRLHEPMKLSIDRATTTTLTPRASAGIALAEPGNTWADLLRYADIALYHAKTQPGEAVLYTRGMLQPPLPTAHHGPRLRDQSTGPPAPDAVPGTRRLPGRVSYGV